MSSPRPRGADFGVADRRRLGERVLDSPPPGDEGSAVRCASCGTELIPGKRFCHACGAALRLTCGGCGQIIDPGFRFCPDCGAAIGADAALPAAEPEDRFAHLARKVPEELAKKILSRAGASSGERKLVTVLFCDLVGSTSLAEQLDPEEFHDLLEGYLELSLREIYRFEGIVTHLAGDGLMAVFGAPIAHEDAPQRALRAALAIRDALKLANASATERDQRHPELRVRIGIHTGPVVVGTVGNDLKMDYTAIGDTTNLTSRLQSLAEPGMILVSEATERRIRGMFDVGPLVSLAVRGKSEPVSAFSVLGLHDAATPIAAMRELTPFVGRSEELAQLWACFERLRGRLAQVVAVVGKAGSGKSRLLYEFKRSLAGEDIAILEARCSSLSQSLPYAPWISMLRLFFELGADDDSAQACRKITRKLDETGVEFAATYPAICRMLSVPFDGHAEVKGENHKQASFEALAKLFVRTSERSPVVMIIEDLHWIDEASREMLELAVSRLGGGRMMVVVSHRPDFQPAWRLQTAFTQLQLDRLSERHATEIIRAVAGGPLSSEIEELILSRAEGNPFFTEEMTRALIEEGSDQVRIPGTVEEVIAARVDRLGSHAKRVVQVASVLGRQFERRRLAALLEGESIDVASELDALERRGVIHRKSVFSDDEYRFGESLTQTVAYEGLLLKDRRQLHERIGLLLESEGDGASIEREALLAHHFARSENRERALSALLAAAQRAEQLPSYRSAQESYREAWEIAESALADTTGDPRGLAGGAVRAATGLCRMTVIYGLPATPATERAARAGRELARAAGDKAGFANMTALLGMLLGSDRHRFLEGLALVEESLAAVRQDGLPIEATIGIARGLAWAYVHDGRLALARDAIESSLAQLEQLGHRDSLSDVYLGTRYLLDRVLLLSDELEPALRAVTDTFELARRGGNRTVQSASTATLAQICLLRGDYASSREWAERSIETSLGIDHRAAVQVPTAVALLARLALGESFDASPYAERIEQGWPGSRDPGLHCPLLVEALLSINQVDRAERCVTHSRERSGGRLQEAMSLGAEGRVMVRLGRPHWDRAELCFDQSARLARELGAGLTLALARLGAVELAHARDDDRGRLRLAVEARAICRKLGLRHLESVLERLVPAHAEHQPPAA